MMPTPGDRHLIVPAEPRLIRELAERLRLDDVAELQAAGTGPMKALWRSYRASHYAKVAFVDGELAAAWGLAGEPLGRSGRPWLLTAPPVERVKRTFVLEARKEVEQMLRINPVLWGYVDDTYKKAIRLLELIGFSIGDIVPLGPLGSPFRMYSIDRRN